MNTRDYLRRRVTAAVYRRLTPAELFALARDGDGEAFAALVCRKFAYVAAICRTAVGTAGPVEDLTLDVFLELWRQRERVRDPGRLDGWLARTARNRAVNWAVARSRERRGVAAGPAAGTDPPAAAERNEVATRVRRAIAELSEEDRAVLAVAGASDAADSAAGLLGVSVATYRTRLHRARQRLRTVLSRYGLGPLLGLLWTAAGSSGRARRPGAWRVMLLGLTVGAAGAAGVLIGRAWWGPPTPPPAPPTALVGESVPEKNRLAFDRTVRPRLQAALETLLAGRGGRAVITGVVTRGTVVQVEVELRHGPPQTHVSRLELLFCTHRRFRLFQLDAWGTGRFENANPRDPVTLTRNRVGAPDLTRPVTGLREADAALRLLPTDPRGEDVEREYRTALARVVQSHAGRWLVRGDPARAASVEALDYWHWPVGISPPGQSGSLPAAIDYRWAAGGRVEATCGDLGGIVFSADGTRIDFPRTGEWWVRPAGDTSSGGR